MSRYYVAVLPFFIFIRRGDGIVRNIREECRLVPKYLFETKVSPHKNAL